MLALEQVSGVTKALQMSMVMLLAKKFSKVNLKPFYSQLFLTIFVKI